MSKESVDNVLILYPNNDLGFQLLHIKQVTCQNNVAEYRNIVLITPFRVKVLVRNYFDVCIIKPTDKIVSYLKRSLKTPNTIVIYGRSNEDTISTLLTDNVRFVQMDINLADFINSSPDEDATIENQYGVLNKLQFIYGISTINTLKKKSTTQIIDSGLQQQAIRDLIDINMLSKQEKKILQLE